MLEKENTKSRSDQLYYSNMCRSAINNGNPKVISYRVK
jgi:hypothetical protein